MGEVLQKQKARKPARYLINQPASQSGKSVKADQLYQVHKAKVVKKKKQVERQRERKGGGRMGFILG